MILLGKEKGEALSSDAHAMIDAFSLVRLNGPYERALRNIRVADVFVGKGRLAESNRLLDIRLGQLRPSHIHCRCRLAWT